MTLFNIALKNIKRNFYNYFIYLVSMISSIMIYYTFTSIQYNEQVLTIVGLDRRIDVAFKASSIVIAIFTAMFIWYSNTFFTKKRKKEVGLYSLMGIRKKEIGRMLFYENILMGILALGAGIFMGTLLSKVFVMLLIKLMGFYVGVKFTIIPKAIINTIITFAILFFITSIHGYTIIYRFKLVELFKADKKGEKEPKGSIIFAILGIGLIVGGYALYLLPKFPSLFSILGTLIIVVIGTYFFFSSFVIFMIKLGKRNNNQYYRGTNMIRISQLLYRIKGHSRTLATIAVLSATTLTAMGVTASFYYDFQSEIDSNYPFSYAFISNDENLNKKVEGIMKKYPQNAVINSVEFEFVQVRGKLPRANKYKQEQETINIISESKFNEIAQIRGFDEKINLANMEEAVIIDEFYNKSIKDGYIGKTGELYLGNEKKQFKVVDNKFYSLLNRHMVFNILVVKDEIYNEHYNKDNIIFGKAYINGNQKNSEELTEELTKLLTRTNMKKDEIGRQFTSYYYNYKEGLISSGLTVFIGAFLGLVFLLSTGSIIFFKQLSEASDDKGRYKILRNIGVSKKEIKISIAKQMFFVFLLPLAVGIMHSLVATALLNKILNVNLAIPLSLSMGAYTIIYMVYYILTVNSYDKIVNSKV
ncbi:FtsX-like permease family protein [Maledivibacter halophilus]|uniref:Putative ABC transport system permease protein n=1 Tax=Maledivibacter halophilus TaxID=36842 RepID=A0A1T5MEX5_9FIRM|nr:ABC transporter permease [Maledivibacter halophilus]SKC86468.1 putative ABC transport system permease protein [Maledivibacter halophilus]